MKVHAYDVFDYEDSKHPLVAEIYYDTDSKEYIAKRTSDDVMYGMFCVYGPEFGLAKPIGTLDTVQGSLVIGFLEDRVIPPTRQLIRSSLEEVGLYTYDWRDMILFNRGRTTNDPYEVLPHEGYDYRDYDDESLKSQKILENFKRDELK